MKKLLYLLIASLLLSATDHYSPVVRPGKDFALFFAVKDYDSWTDLANPIIDAEAIAKELREGYGFQTEVVKNPGKQEILTKLQEYRNKTYSPDGQLLVFFSGHGAFVEETREGFFIPRDAQKNDPFQESYLSHERLESWTGNIPCNHILVAIDACYSGTFSKELAYKGDDWKRPGEEAGAIARFIETSLEPRTRLFLTSGGKERTPDPSEFAQKYLDGLKQSRRDRAPVVTIEELYVNHIKQASPKPKFGAFGENEYDSQFLFVLKEETSPGYDPVADRQAWEAAEAAHKVGTYRDYLARFPQGEFRELAQLRVQEIEAAKQDYQDWLKAKNAGTKEAYQTYLNDHPSGAYRELAEIALQNLTTPTSAEATAGRQPPEAPDNMVYVEGGTFTMGCTSEQGSDCNDDEKPAHQVTVKSFYMGKYEVTNKEFCEFLNEKGNQTEGGTEWLELSSRYCLIEKSGSRFVPKSGKENHPVIKVSWYGARAFCSWLGEKAGRPYRLPTEAEWEYAARGGKKSRGYKYAGSNNLDEVGWYISNSRKGTNPVGQKKANELGIYDMSGNVWEWCQDWYSSSYYKDSEGEQNSTGPSSGSSRVLRGGSWGDVTRLCRISNRGDASSNTKFNGILLGFRLVQDSN